MSLSTRRITKTATTSSRQARARKPRARALARPKPSLHRTGGGRTGGGRVCRKITVHVQRETQAQGVGLAGRCGRGPAEIQKVGVGWAVVGRGADAGAGLETRGSTRMTTMTMMTTKASLLCRTRRQRPFKVRHGGKTGSWSAHGASSCCGGRASGARAARPQRRE